MINILYGICFSFVIVEVLNIKQYINRKPFNCGVCLSGWITLALCILDHSSILNMFPAMVGYILLEKILYKL
jgi:hypothetical protein